MMIQAMISDASKSSLIQINMQLYSNLIKSMWACVLLKKYNRKYIEGTHVCE